MFKKVALKELKQLKRDKKSFSINILFPFFVIILIAIMGVLYGNVSDEKERYVIATNSKYIESILSDNENYEIKFMDTTDSVDNYVKKEKSSLGVLWYEDENKVTYVENIDSDKEIKLVKDNILKIIQLNNFNIDSKKSIGLESISVSTDYKPITTKLTAVICAFLVILLSFRLNNVNSFYLTVNEKSTGNLEVLISTPIKEKDIIIGKWVANFCSCGVLTLAVLIPIYLVFTFLFQCLLGIDMNLLYKLPLVVFEVIIFCLVISLFQLFLGYMAKSIKEAQMYLAYSPLVLFVPLSIFFGIDIKNLASYVFSSIFIDCIPILNFYDLIQMSMLEIFDVRKLILIMFSNLLFTAFIFKILVNLFGSEKNLIFKN